MTTNDALIKARRNDKNKNASRESFLS